jgi:twitching motility protein PilU
MITFDQSLYDLYNEGAISLEEALNHADSRNNLALRIRLNAGVEADNQGAAKGQALG